MFFFLVEFYGKHRRCQGTFIFIDVIKESVDEWHYCSLRVSAADKTKLVVDYNTIFGKNIIQTYGRDFS